MDTPPESELLVAARRGDPAAFERLVSRHRRELYEEIKRAFAGHETVQVILDRRVSQRREKKNSPMLDRRRNERRSRSAMDEQLRTIGWSLVLLDLARAKRN